MKQISLVLGIIAIAGFVACSRGGGDSPTGAAMLLTLLSSKSVAVPIQRLSIDSSGAQGNNDSCEPMLSEDGRYVAFSSRAANLVPGDTNGISDVFVHDRQTQAIERVSVDSNGVQGDSSSFTPSISADGRYVAFHSIATNLVSGDTNGSPDIFVHDRQTQAIERVSVDSNGVQGDSESYAPSISADGRFVSFESTATNLVSGDTNGYSDIFVHDRQTKTTERVSVDSSGVEGDSDSLAPSISADGRFVAFYSIATNLVSGDTNGYSDIFVDDRQTKTTERVSVDSSGVEGDSESVAPSISAGGRFVSFESAATNLVSGDTNGFFDIFVYDLQTNAIQRLSVDSNGVQGDSDSNMASISADGRYVAFHSYATNLVSGDTNGFEDIFVYDRQTNAIKRVNVDPGGAEGNMGGFDPCISADGQYVVFTSSATNLVTGDTNGFMDIFAAPVQ